MGENSHTGEQPTTQNQNNSISDDPSDGRHLADKTDAHAGTAVEQRAPGDSQEQPTPEDFGKRGMGVAAKE